MDFLNQAHKFALKTLNHILTKNKLKVFLNWKYSCKPKQIKSILQPSLKLDIIEKVNPVVKKCNKIILSSSKGPKYENSPRDVSQRLYNYAQEIENHKNEIRKSLLPDYSFTPKLSSGTKKWLNSKSKKDIRIPDEEIAVVSGSKVLNFTKFANNFEGILETKLPSSLPTSVPKSATRIITTRLERRSDIVSRLYPSPTKPTRTRNVSIKNLINKIT
jgi:hypothetical protein